MIQMTVFRICGAIETCSTRAGLSELDSSIRQKSNKLTTSTIGKK